MGMSNGIGTIAGLLCPIAIDYLTSDQVSYFNGYFKFELPLTLKTTFQHPLN